MRTRTLCLALAMMVWTATSNAMAQNAGASAGYLALVSTPAGSVPPIVKSWMLADPAIVPGVGVEAQWGHIPGTHGRNTDTFTSAASLPFASGNADADVSIGLLLASCDIGICGGFLVVSSGVEGRLLHARAGGATVTLGLGGHVGFGMPSEGERWSLWTNAPLSIAIGPEGGMQLVPFMSPGFGWGRVENDSSSRSGARLLLGGGVGVLNARSGVGITLSAQKIFIKGGNIVFGAALTWSKQPLRRELPPD